jgi:hypothetical protein
MPSANITLKKLLDTPITVVPIKIPEKNDVFCGEQSVFGLEKSPQP